MGRADLAKEPRQVAAMFDGVAERYDRTNTFMSARPGPSLASAHRPRPAACPGQRLLDVAAGTAVSTRALSATGAWCVATDFSFGMLWAGRHRAGADGGRRRAAPAVRRRAASTR